MNVDVVVELDAVCTSYRTRAFDVVGPVRRSRSPKRDREAWPLLSSGRILFESITVTLRFATDFENGLRLVRRFIRTGVSNSG
jgi:hypothetical protein